eukprot:5541392-Amphidinium_carterae.1
MECTKTPRMANPARTKRREGTPKAAVLSNPRAQAMKKTGWNNASRLAPMADETEEFPDEDVLGADMSMSVILLRSSSGVTGTSSDPPMVIVPFRN